MNKDKNIKWVASKVAPSVQEADYWIDLSADPNGSVIKYPNGKLWMPMIQTLSATTVKKMVSAAFDKLDMIKVNKEEGKKLSTNDFTNDYKKKLDELKNYDDTELQEAIIEINDNIEIIKNAIVELTKRINDLEQSVA